MSDRSDGFPSNSSQAVHGWLLSVVIHGGLIAGIVLTMSQVMEVKKPDPFRLDISLVTLPPDPVKQPQPVTHTPESKPVLERQPVRKKPVQQVVQEQPVEQKIVREMRRPTEPVKRQMVKSVTSVPVPVKQQRDLKPETVQQKITPTPVTKTEVARVQPQVQPQTRSEPQATHRPVSTAKVPVTKPVRQPTSQPVVQTAQAVSRNGAKPTTHAVEAKAKMVSKPVPAIVSGAISRTVPRPVSRPHTPVQAKAPPVKSVARRSIQRKTIKKELPDVVVRELETTPLPAADYGWVADTLLKRVQQLKRYPSRARRKIWEGTVELRVLINAAGEIQDVQVLASSGHNLLDQEALNTIKMASPLTLRHRIKHPVVMVDLPIVYKLN
ncbi:TonB family protein [Nitrospira sp. M1]